jgi:hypothetical protein
MCLAWSGSNGFSLGVGLSKFIDSKDSAAHATLFDWIRAARLGTKEKENL